MNEYGLKFIDQENDVYVIEMVEFNSKKSLLELYHEKTASEALLAKPEMVADELNKPALTEPPVAQEPPRVKLIVNQMLETTCADHNNFTLAQTTANISSDDDDNAVAESLAAGSSK